ncbi:hypothetical protein PPL_09983 [Heterostelium album PN500]|uniref:Uncharacterized protein n=1 Tax=Heterostelium pallidum (strain ATCC 26659 / Pp 5 / PN500) TaxID=670386 RepID=D3BPT9_HETP5|nr:hypothetical protein PPL_09983 [Heterostelium album PN500]EFA76222.1 hypothetical protein PPL_09983 [Heterostelium album PN500]|eukprot:XP_020428355.1 hypothetical protein PPL_09983 [Heterostelium album PN500]
MFKYIFLTLAVLAITTHLVEANAGFITPLPRIKCTEKDHAGCNIKTPCVTRSTPMVNAVYFKEAISIAIYQKDSHATSNSTNTYTIQFFPDGSDTGYQLTTFNQNKNMTDKTSYKLTIDPLSTFEDMRNEEIVPFKDGISLGYLQMTFDTRVNGVNVSYYSCADVMISKEKIAPSKGSIYTVNGVITVADPENGDPIGNSNIDARNQTIDLQDLVNVEDQAKKGNSAEVNADQQSEASNHKDKNSAIGTYSTSNVFIIVTTITSLFLFSRVWN